MGDGPRRKERVQCKRRNCTGSCPLAVVLRGRQPGRDPAVCLVCGDPFKAPPGSGDLLRRRGGSEPSKLATENKDLKDRMRKLEERLAALDKDKQASPAGASRRVAFKPQGQGGGTAAPSADESHDMDEDGDDDEADKGPSLEALINSKGAMERAGLPADDPGVVHMEARIKAAREARDRSRPAKFQVLRAEKAYQQASKVLEKQTDRVKKLESELAAEEDILAERQCEMAAAAEALRKARIAAVAEVPGPDTRPRAQAVNPQESCLSHLLEALVAKCSDPAYAGLMGNESANDLLSQWQGFKSMAANFEAMQSQRRRGAGHADAGREDPPRDLGPPAAGTPAGDGVESDITGIEDNGEAENECEVESWAERIQRVRNAPPLGPVHGGPGPAFVGHRPAGCAIGAAHLAGEAEGLLAASARRSRDERAVPAFRRSRSAARRRERTIHSD